MPTWRRGYWMWIFRSARSMKTTKVMTAMTMTITPMMTAAEMLPTRPCSKNRASAPGMPATMPTKMMSEVPLPMPRAVICSPIHIRNMVPPTRVMTVDAWKKRPGSCARLPASMLLARP